MKKLLLPTNLEEGKSYYTNFDSFDVVFVTGDSYYDHPLNGVAILFRLLESKGYKAGVISQPASDRDYLSCGKPKYFFSITSGFLDSMLANYTPMLKKRENVIVPERALMVYTSKIKQLFKGCKVVLGGVEATIRRFTHFDYRDNCLRRGILNDTKADFLLFGTAERPILMLLSAMKLGNRDVSSIEGIAYRVGKDEIASSAIMLPSFEECVSNADKFNLLARTTHFFPDSSFIEPCGKSCIRHNRTAHRLSEEEMDFIYRLPFTRKLHPAAKNYESERKQLKMLENSVAIGRGCWGNCNFCIIPLVQGREISERSKESILKEIEMLYQSGIKKIDDLTLPTINMYGSYCTLYDTPIKIYSPIIEKEITVYEKTKQCSYNCVGCKNRVLSDKLHDVLSEISELNMKYGGSLELRSAIRHDIILSQKRLFRKIMEFTQRLKIAPEHISGRVLKQMNKGTPRALNEFLREYEKVNKEQGTEKNLVPYWMAAHPGATLGEAKKLAAFCREKGLYVNLTQVFTPTPGTISTAMYFTGKNPITGEKVYVARGFREKKAQKNILLGNQPTAC